MDALLGTLMFVFALIWILAVILRIWGWVQRMKAQFCGPDSVDDTLREMGLDREYAGTRNAKQQLRKP